MPGPVAKTLVDVHISTRNGRLVTPTRKQSPEHEHDYERPLVSPSISALKLVRCPGSLAPTLVT
ncbi:MAG: hypothetical protein QOH39_3159 [Verrucomicrobiota bacterium]|jgi:hypothetical protein